MAKKQTKKVTPIKVTDNFSDQLRQSAVTLNEAGSMEPGLIERFDGPVNKVVNRLLNLANAYDRALVREEGRVDRETKATERKTARIAKLMARQARTQAELEKLAEAK